MMELAELAGQANLAAWAPLVNHIGTWVLCIGLGLTAVCALFRLAWWLGGGGSDK